MQQAGSESSSPSLKLPRLYAIVDAETLATQGIPLRRFVEDLRDAGVRLVQYRDKLGDEEQILRNAETIAEVFRDTEATLVMNDSARLARLAGWTAVHVGQDDAAVAEARAALPHGALVGCSTHTDDQIRSADEAGADYIAIGPVFATATKSNAEPVVGLEGVRRARSLTKRPLIAIGGITQANASRVIDAGADSLAVIGALCRQGEDTAALAREFLQAISPDL